LRPQGIPIHHLDLGGGLGITYTDETPPSADVLIGQLLARIDARGHGQREVALRTGALTGGQCRRAADRSAVPQARFEQKNFCVVDAAMNDLMRPALYEAYMGIVNTHQRS
jgi:diaminopimelate decarboxylase